MIHILSQNESFSKGLLALFCAVSFLLIWMYQIPHPGLTRFDIQGSIEYSGDKPLYEEHFASKAQTLKAHAASTYVENGQLVAHWYGGSKEGAGDVQIFRATFRDDAWTGASPIVNPARVQRDLARFVRKVGNPVGFGRSDGRIWLFFVSVSIGGWAGSSINLIESSDQGKTWGRVRKLITSPFLNLSTLVRNPPYYYSDGTVGLPVYHEFLGKFGEILRLDSDARILDKIRLSSGSHALQPVIVPISDTHAIGLMRYAGAPPRHLLKIETFDGGNNWSLPGKLNIPNPNAAVAAVHLGDNRIMAVINNSVMGRYNLGLAISADGDDWRVFHELESENVSPASHDFEFSYPSLTRDASGIFDLLYSWNDENIKHVRFNDAWLNDMLDGSGKNNK
jgi:predicted neuraminidase